MSGKSGMSGRSPTTARHINAFSCPTWLSLCRAHVGHVGRARLHGDIRRDGWKGMGRMRPVGGMGDTRRTGRPFPWRLAFPGVHARPAVSIRGRCGSLDAPGVHPETSCVCSCPTSCQRHNKNPARAGIEPTYRRHKHARAPSQSGYTCGESIRLACLPRAVNRSYFLISVQNFLTFRL